MEVKIARPIVFEKQPAATTFISYCFFAVKSFFRISSGREKKRKIGISFSKKCNSGSYPESSSCAIYQHFCFTLIL